MRKATGCTRTMTPNTQVATYRVSLKKITLIGGKSPAESPDINCIEKVWAALKHFLRDKHKPKNLAELKEGIKVFWKRMTPEVCARYVGHLDKVLPAVVEAEGGPTGH